MVRKIFTYIGIILGCALLFVVGSVVIMFLAPGVELFGIRYVTNKQGVYELPESNQLMENFGGDIYIETDEVPINIKYSLVSNAKLEYRQEFVGFTRSENKTPSVDVSINNDNLYITSHDLVKFVYAQDFGSDGAYLNLYLPYSFSSKSINIKSENSSVNFNATGSKPLKDVNIETAGNINIVGDLNANSIMFYSKQPITINENITANHIKLVATTNNINILKDIAGTLEVETGTASLYMKNANNLIFKTTSGSLKPVDGFSINLVTANVETHSGNINITNITGIQESVIKTISGIINLGFASNVTISNSRSPIYIDKINRAVITGGIGVVNIKEVLTSIDVETRNGAIFLGTGDLSVSNVKAKSLTGRIVAKNVVGVADLNSVNNSVELIGKALTNTTINADEFVSAKKLTGEINITSNGDVNLQVDNVSGDININTNDGCKSVILDIKNNAFNELNYDLKSTKGRTINVYAGDSILSEGESELKREPAIVGLFNITVATTYANMFIYTK